ncbi:MAG: hypothetical protein ACOZF0_13155 [Thermodesulfobacteriota bacterium]
MPVGMVETFIRQSIEKNILWQRIRLLGGEPTLHSRIFDIIRILTDYQRKDNPHVSLVIGTNYFGPEVHRVLDRLPPNIAVKSTLKKSRRNLFRPFNVAPKDTFYNRFSDYSCGCRIIADCGLGVTPSGYYMCAVAGGIDRVFKYHLGRQNLPDKSDSLSDQMAAFCCLCGHFGFMWPTKKSKISKTWLTAYDNLR